MDFLEQERQPNYRASTAAVLEYAWDAGRFRADHVIDALGLTRSTTLAALDSLIELGLVQELATVEPPKKPRKGRPARHFEFRGKAGCLIGVDAGDTHLTAMVADLTGEILSRRRADIRSFADTTFGPPDPRLRRAAIFDLIDDALAAAGASRAEVVAVGVGIPAPVDFEGRSPTNPRGFWQHMNADLQDALAAVFPAVRLENDASLAAIAEGSRGRAQGRQHYVAMLSGRRLGSGVVVGGRLLRGAHGAIGELDAFTYVTGVGSTTGLGALIEDWVLQALADKRIPADHPWAGLAPNDVTAEAVLSAAGPDDPFARAMLDDVGGTLGIIGSVLGRFYDPEVIVVCGAMATAIGEILAVASERMADRIELPPPALVTSELGGDVVCIGAVSAAREAARGLALDLFTARAEEGSATD